ncbi:pectin lyase-like protein [Xylariaceae sp. FL0255]|nr:pectin lyase-like protein [Xylariaceae sp. FL0255]
MIRFSLFSLLLLATSVLSTPLTRQTTSYWYEGITHSGIAPYNAAPSSYPVYRNVKDYGATGNGVTDDTAAIQAAIDAGSRCVPGSCSSSTTSPAVVYFPAGTYLISADLIIYYYTSLVGNPNSLPTIKVSSSWSGSWAIDADPYGSSGNQDYGDTDVFYREIRNLKIDTTSVPSTKAIAGIHWPTSQATSIQNVDISLSTASGNQHTGIFIENGSAGFLADITINGGLNGLNIGNQQYTLRDIKISNAATGIYQLWSWGFTYQGVTITDCTIGIDMYNGGSDTVVGSLLVLDSTFSSVGTAVRNSYQSSNSASVNGTLVLENVVFQSVTTGIVDNGATTLAGGSTTIQAWGQGTEYTPSGPTRFQGSFTPLSRPSSLLSGSNYFTMSKPGYTSVTSANVLTARSYGAKGDGVTDDTAALQSLINAGASSGKLIFIDAGYYVVTSTLSVPPGANIVGEFLATVIMASGSKWANVNNPLPVIQVGTPGQTGTVQLSDLILSTKGSAPGAVLIEWNLASSSTGSGMWDVHSRIGGFTGSNLQVAQCPTSAAESAACMAGYLSLHITSKASHVYLENNWFWTADHDLDTSASTQISIYSGRGMLVESAGPVWLVGTAVEHHSLYQYQITGSSALMAGFVQTETPYYQPSPNAINSPYPENSTLNDPTFSNCATTSGNCDAWGMRILNSENVFVYGTGFYSWFNNYNDACSSPGNGESCQSMIFDVQDSTSVAVYTLTTIGSEDMVTKDGAVAATYSSNKAVYGDTIAYFEVPA